jgi:hypothetical protein
MRGCMKALSKAPCDEEPLFGTVSFKMPLPAPLNGYGSGWTLPYTHAKSEDWTLTLSDPSGPQRYPGSASIAALDKEIARRAREDEVSRRLMTVPGIGPISATAIVALAPPAETVAKGRDFAAWLGLTPLQRSTGGKQRLGATSKMGERTLRRLFIIGSSTVVLQASKRGAPRGSWLEQMLVRKPRMPVTVARPRRPAPCRVASKGTGVFGTYQLRQVLF